MTRENPPQTDRGQAYTLEGFVGAIIVLTAVLFALQSVVITPTTGGSVDRTVQAQLQQEAQDALVVAESDGDLSYLVRYWNDSEKTYHNASSTDSVNYTSSDFTDNTTMGEDFGFGTIVEHRFEESGRSYNVELVYRDGDDGENRSSFNLVYQGQPSPNAFSSSYMVTLYEDQRLTAPDNEDQTLEDADDYPIPPIADGEDGNLYNVVEVRLTVW
ncbi:DUF7288 family protein [Halomontanus rarus]|uniref:DUF7288 family protein n=1 Tax=Halomontanus rarus TaxID=3034020 RepID=UPI0023E86050|nr:hypothetical protein [Halovivax sp. TS33]